jgi:hypothetical protein
MDVKIHSGSITEGVAKNLERAQMNLTKQNTKVVPAN